MLKRKSDLFLLFILIIVLVIILVLIINNFNTLFIRTIETEFIVSENAGFDLNNSALKFGSITPGQTASRSIFITNEFNKKVRVELVLNGQVKGYIYSDENNFYLDPKEEKKVNFKLITPEDINYGEYNGELEIRFKRI